METLRKLFQMVRWTNLMMMLLTIILMEVCVIDPLLGVASFGGGLDIVTFIMFAATVIAIAKGGYILNDIKDIQADSMNKPGKNLIGSVFTEQQAWGLYGITTGAALIIGLILSFMLGQWNYVFIFILSAGLLWFYSQKYQCQPLIGNLVVALLSALSFGLVWLFDFFALSGDTDLFVSLQPAFSQVTFMVLLYTGFAFITTLFRELIKDVEDLKGDDRFGCRTLPVVYGITVSRVFIMITGLILLSGLIWASWVFYQLEYLWSAFWFILMAAWQIIIMFTIYKASVSKDYGRISLWTKLLMAGGILSMVLIYFEHP